ncbi:MAG TPA: DedA family protein [Candidatus Bathyarchaeia archaeon]|nr:DedA family protein [Candidatus Bathyarchaeia archaeon]
MLALSLNILETLSNFVISVIEQLGYAGVFVAMGLESACIPLPSEVIMPFAGFVVWKGELTLIGVALAGTAGCLAGSLVAYSVGAYGGLPLLERYGKYVLIRKSELDRAHTWFGRYGEIAVFVGRVLPIVRTFISLPAGVARMDVKKFSLYTVLGSLPWCFGLAYVGILLGPHWSDLEALFRYLDIVVIAGIIGLVGYLIYHRKRIVSLIRS